MEFGMAIPEELFDSDADIVAVFLTCGQLEKLAEVLRNHEDRGPHGMGWQSEELGAITEIVCRQATSLAKERSG